MVDLELPARAACLSPHMPLISTGALPTAGEAVIEIACEFAVAVANCRQSRHPVRRAARIAVKFPMSRW